MKHKTIITTLCALLLALFGCERAAVSHHVSDGAWHVDGNTGVATGKDALGIDFEVAGATSAASKCELHGDPRLSSWAEITLADDLKIRLVTRDEGEVIGFQLNGRQVGDLKRGDKVVIDEKRSVTVNGEKRTTADNPQE